MTSAQHRRVLIRNSSDSYANFSCIVLLCPGTRLAPGAHHVDCMSRHFICWRRSTWVKIGFFQSGVFLLGSFDPVMQENSQRCSIRYSHTLKMKTTGRVLRAPFVKTSNQSPNKKTPREASKQGPRARTAVQWRNRREYGVDITSYVYFSPFSWLSFSVH